MLSRVLFLASLSLIVLGLTGCQTASDYPVAAAQPGRALPPVAISGEGVRYAIVPELSDVRFLVFRAGPMARLGHNHVVQAKNIRGEIRLTADIHQSSFSIEIPVKDFQVDAAGPREDEGAEFLPLPDDEAIAGTTRNMLGEKVLDAAKYPAIEIKSVALKGPAWGMDTTVRIRMHGVEREIVVPTVVEQSGDKLVVSAIFSIRQTDFGIVPMSVLGGAMQVDDTVKTRMRIVASELDRLPR